MKVAIAGSRQLPKGIAPRLLVRFLAAIPEDSVVMLRRGRTTGPGVFEQQTAMVAEMLGLTVEWMQPEPPTPEPGITYDLRAVAREATFARDLEFVVRCELLLCFYTAEQEGDETSGTAALVDKAIAENRPVYAYAIGEDGVVRSGEHDPRNDWADKVPNPG